MSGTNATTMNSKREETNRGWVLYDGECPLCIASAKKFAPLLHRHGFDFAPLQTRWVQERLGLKPDELLAEMKLLTDEGKVFGGADAVLQIARKIWWAWPLFVLAQIPGAKNLFRAIYRRVAANRHCLGVACAVQISSPHRHATFFEIP
jgi:predicted DCC family thiol-disulfide oxidoreductase YuxK